MHRSSPGFGGMALRPVGTVRNTVQEPSLVDGSPIVDIKPYVPARFAA